MSNQDILDVQPMELEQEELLNQIEENCDDILTEQMAAHVTTSGKVLGGPPASQKGYGKRLCNSCNRVIPSQHRLCFCSMKEIKKAKRREAAKARDAAYGRGQRGYGRFPKGAGRAHGHPRGRGGLPSQAAVFANRGRGSYQRGNGGVRRPNPFHHGKNGNRGHAPAANFSTPAPAPPTALVPAAAAIPPPPPPPMMPQFMPQAPTGMPMVFNFNFAMPTMPK